MPSEVELETLDKNVISDLSKSDCSPAHSDDNSSHTKGVYFSKESFSNRRLKKEATRINAAQVT